MPRSLSRSRGRHQPVADVEGEQALAAGARDLRFELRVPPHVIDVDGDAERGAAGAVDAHGAALRRVERIAQVERLLHRVDAGAVGRVHRMQRLDRERHADAPARTRASRRCRRGLRRAPRTGPSTPARRRARPAGRRRPARGTPHRAGAPRRRRVGCRRARRAGRPRRAPETCRRGSSRRARGGARATSSAGALEADRRRPGRATARSPGCRGERRPR